MRGCLWVVWVLAAVMAGCGGSGRSGSAVIPVGGPIALDSVRYQIELMEEGTGKTEAGPAVRVTMTVMGRGDKISRLAMAPEWGGVQDCARFVHGLEVRDGTGHICTVKRNGPGWDVEHEQDAVLTATYELHAGDHDPLAQFGTHYEPVVRRDLFQLIGETGLIYPEWLEDRGPIEIGVEWAGWDGWTTVSSFPERGGDADKGKTLNTNKVFVHRPLSEFRHGTFMAGPADKLRVVDRKVKGGLLRVAVSGDDWRFTPEEMADLLARIVGVERDFVSDYGDPYFLVTVVPTGPRADARSVSMGGTGLTDCFALFLAPGSAVAEGSTHRQRVLHLLAHEYFHTWNGGEIGMKVPPPEQLTYWFSEGFTDFYASRLLLRANLIDDAAWLMRMNETLQTLYLSPVATAPASLIEKEFWTRAEVRDLPYKRGEVVALCIDEEIRRVSGGKKSLDDFFLAVLADGRRGEEVDTDRLLTRVEEWTSPEFAATIRKVVVDGALPEAPKAVSAPRADLVDRESYQWDAGFDVDGSVKARVVAGVKEGSAAYVAGLRDGMEIAGMSVHGGDPEKEVTLTVKSGDGRKEIRYWPRAGKPIRVVQYKLK